jgi:hypothetical protein
MGFGAAGMGSAGGGDGQMNSSAGGNNDTSNFDEHQAAQMNSMMFMNPMGFGAGHFSMNQGGSMADAMSMGAMGGGNNPMNSDFVPGLDMMALYRAKQNMMGRGRPGASVQDKMFAFSQDQYAKGQGLPMSGTTGRVGGMDSMFPSAAFMGGHATAGMDMSTSSSGMKRSAVDTEAVGKTKAAKEKGGKRRKKAKKSNDMPRRALSAYNIFFSEQREVILKEIEAKEKDGKNEDDDAEDKPEEETNLKAEKNDDDEEKSSKKKGDEEIEDTNEEEDKDGKVPKVLNRTFFPKRAKRAHRKVHGKIGLVDLAREVSKRWKELSPEKRKVYEDLAAEDRKRHKEVMAEYQERKAAENMVSMGADDSGDEEEGAAKGDGASRQATDMPSDQDMRESMAHMHQQRILAEMMAARRSQGDQMSMMNSNFMMGRGGGMNMSDMQAMQNMSSMQDMNAMLEFQNQQTQRALMLQRMRMGGGMGGNFGMGMDGMGPM